MEEQPVTEELEWNPACYKKVFLPEKLSSLRQKLYQKAKQEPNFRFYVLYDRIYRQDVLSSAYQLVRINVGAPGVDDVSFEEIENRKDGVDGFLKDIHEGLKGKTYKPSAVRRVYIPKADGRKRPLGIPTIRDRVIQMATLLILEPIFEADFLDCSYGFRPERSAHDALREVRKNLKAGRVAVYDADLRAYFDSIPHDKLMKCLRMRIVDRSVLKLIKMWLNAPIVEKDGRGGTKVSRSKTGTPQGGVISPLLANVYLHWFDKVFNRDGGPGQWANARIVRYADDFVVMARYQTSRLRECIESNIEQWLGLELNRDKTKVADLKTTGGSLDFLGFTFRYDRDLRGRNHRYLNIFPSKKAMDAEREKLRQMINERKCYVPIPMLIGEVNRHLKGWTNYFSFGYPRKAFREVNRYVRMRCIKHLRRRSQRPYRPPQGRSYYRHLSELGLIYL